MNCCTVIHRICLFSKASFLEIFLSVCKFHASIPEMQVPALVSSCVWDLPPQTSSHRPLPHPQSAGMCEPQPGQSSPRLFIEIPRWEEFSSCPSDIGHLPSSPWREQFLNGQQAEKDPDTGSWDPGRVVPAAWASRLPWASGCYPGMLSSKSFSLHVDLN